MTKLLSVIVSEPMKLLDATACITGAYESMQSKTALLLIPREAYKDNNLNDGSLGTIQTHNKLSSVIAPKTD